jgi:hypothetical protein
MLKQSQNEPFSGNFEKAAEANSLFACHISLDGKNIFLRTLTADDCSGGLSFPRWQLGVIPELSAAPASISCLKKSFSRGTHVPPDKEELYVYMKDKA